MAATAPKDMEQLLDEFICSICRDYFKDPVNTSCGHNFCRGCIIQYWETCKAIACPECRHVCSETELLPNVQLAKAAETTKHSLSAAPERPVTDSGVCKIHGAAPKLSSDDAQTPICAYCKESQLHRDRSVNCLEDAAQDPKTTRRPKTLSRCEEEENFLKPSKILSESKTEAYTQDIEPTELSPSANKEPFLVGPRPPALWLGNYRIPKERIYQGCIVVLLLAIPACVFIGVGRSNSPVTAKEPEAPNCPDGWVGYLKKCYYFSETEGTWADSQSHCSSLNASLAVIDTTQDLAFLFRYKGFFNHWIGLWRDQAEQLWKWPNGTEFNNLFQVKGKGDCVFLNSNDARSANCLLERRWICSTLDGYTKRKQSALHRNLKF